MARRRRKNKKWLIGGLVFVILITVVVATVVIWNNNRQSNGQDNEEIVQNEENTDTERRSEETEDEYSERMAEQKQVKQYEGENPNKTSELSGAITYAGVNGDRLMVGVNIDQFLDDGNCRLSLVRDGDVIYTDDVDIVADVTTSSCDGFDVLVSELGKGATEIIIDLNANGKTGTIRGKVDI